MREFGFSFERGAPLLSSDSHPHPQNREEESRWNYALRLLHYMYSECLLDRQEALQWVVEQVESLRAADLFAPTPGAQRASSVEMARTVLDLCTQFVSEIGNLSEMLSRRLARSVAILLSHHIFRAKCVALALASKEQPACNVDVCECYRVPPATSSIDRLLACDEHSPLLLHLSALLQGLILLCPSALVWNTYPGFPTPTLPPHPLPLPSASGGAELQLQLPAYAHFLSGSPLDLLICDPSALPCASEEDEEGVAMLVRQAVARVVARSAAIESTFSSQCFATATNQCVRRMIEIFEVLDKFAFGGAQSKEAEKLPAAGNWLDALYALVFDQQANKSVASSALATAAPPQASARPALSDAVLVVHLCEWAVRPMRAIPFRHVVVALLLERQQQQRLLAQRASSDASSTSSAATASSTLPLFQEVLSLYLEKRAPSLTPRMLLRKTSARATHSGASPPHLSAASPTASATLKSVSAAKSLSPGAGAADSCADPLLDSGHLVQQRVLTSHRLNAFSSLVALFSELIARGLFSHGAHFARLLASGRLPSPSVSGALRALLPIEPVAVAPAANSSPLTAPNSNDGTGDPLERPKALAAIPKYIASSPSAAAAQQPNSGAQLPANLTSIAELPRHIQYLFHFALPASQTSSRVNEVGDSVGMMNCFIGEISPGTLVYYLYSRENDNLVAHNK